jgi:hypothetical protein
VWQPVGTAIAQGGPWGLLALVVISLIRGWLIPRSWHRDRIADYQRAVDALEATVAEQKQQIAVLLGARTPTAP